MRIRILMFFAFSAIGFSQEKPMTPSEIISFKDKIVKETKLIRNLTTDFVQYKHMSFLSKDIESNGEMMLKAPNKLKWKYVTPFAYSIVFKDNKIFINDQGKKNKIDLGNNKKFEKINSIIIGSISGNLFDEAEFDIQYFRDKKTNIARLNPNNKDIKKYIKEIVLCFKDGQNTVSEVKLIEPSEDYTRIIFKNKKINIILDDSLFTD